MKLNLVIFAIITNVICDVNAVLQKTDKVLDPPESTPNPQQNDTDWKARESPEERRLRLFASKFTTTTEPVLLNFFLTIRNGRESTKATKRFFKNAAIFCEKLVPHQ